MKHQGTVVGRHNPNFGFNLNMHLTATFMHHVLCLQLTRLLLLLLHNVLLATPTALVKQLKGFNGELFAAVRNQGVCVGMYVCLYGASEVVEHSVTPSTATLHYAFVRYNPTHARTHAPTHAPAHQSPLFSPTFLGVSLFLLQVVVPGTMPCTSSTLHLPTAPMQTPKSRSARILAPRLTPALVA